MKEVATITRFILSIAMSIALIILSKVSFFVVIGYLLLVLSGGGLIYYIYLCILIFLLEERIKAYENIREAVNGKD